MPGQKVLYHLEGDLKLGISTDTLLSLGLLPIDLINVLLPWWNLLNSHLQLSLFRDLQTLRSLKWHAMWLRFDRQSLTKNICPDQCWCSKGIFSASCSFSLLWWDCTQWVESSRRNSVIKGSRLSRCTACPWGLEAEAGTHAVLWRSALCWSM